MLRPGASLPAASVPEAGDSAAISNAPHEAPRAQAPLWGERHLDAAHELYAWRLQRPRVDASIEAGRYAVEPRPPGGATHAAHQPLGKVDQAMVPPPVIHAEDHHTR